MIDVNDLDHRLIWNINGNCICNVLLNRRRKCKRVLINNVVMLNNASNKTKWIIILIKYRQFYCY